MHSHISLFIYLFICLFVKRNKEAREGGNKLTELENDIDAMKKIDEENKKNYAEISTDFKKIEKIVSFDKSIDIFFFFFLFKIKRNKIWYFRA